MATLLDLRKNVGRLLIGKNIDEAAFDTQLIICHVLKLSSIDYALENNRLISDDEHKNVMALVKKRCARIPMSQIFGDKEFWSLNFKVTKDTLTPRPDSETLIEVVLKEFQNRNDELRILDMGTGTGCLLLTLLHELPNATGIGIDISDSALKIAKENAVNLGLQNRAKLIISDWMDEIDSNEKFDLIISNPPYIGLEERPDLSPEVKDHEPDSALFSGQKGLDDYIKISKQISPFLKENGFIILEIGHSQASEVSEIFAVEGFRGLGVYKDLGGRDRCLKFRK